MVVDCLSCLVVMFVMLLLCRFGICWVFMAGLGGLFVIVCLLSDLAWCGCMLIAVVCL